MAVEIRIDEALKHLQHVDPILGVIIENAPNKPQFSPSTDYYQKIVDSVISQQLSVKAAATIQRRFNALFGSEDIIPSPTEILTKDIVTLRTAGLSRPKASYILDLAEKVETGTVTFDHLEALSNEEIIADLTKIKGVGVWTVHMFLMFCMGRLDVLPVGDLGIRNGVKKLYGFEGVPTPQEVEIIARQNNWHPYESVASWYIWHSLDNKPPIE